MTEYDLGQVVGADGIDGEDGVGITSITKTGTSGKIDTYTITYSDGSTSTFTVTNGNDGSKGDKGDTGATGKGISSITKTGTSGLVDTYTITYSDSTTSTFTVTNGSDATVTIQTAWGSTTSDSKVPSEKLVKTNLDTKISKSSTSGLVKNDGSIDTTSYSTFSGAYSDLSGIPSSFTPASHTHGQISNDGKITSTAVTVASGDNILITDASDSSKIKRVANLLASHIKDSSAHSNIGSSANDTQATINTNIDSVLGNKVSKSSTTGLIKNDGSIDTSAYITNSALSNYIQKSNTSGLVKNDGTVDTNTYLTTSTASTTYIAQSDIANNLTTTTAGKVLDARQGKALADLIGDAIDYINL